MKTLNYFLAGALLMTACVEKFDTTAPEQNDSEKWEAEFGKVDPNQTWNMATKANLSISAKEAGTIEVFTQNPITEGSMLLMRKQVEAGAHELQFDVPQGTDKVFVQVCNAYGPYVNGYLPLDGTTAVAKAAYAPATTDTDVCPVTVGDKTTIYANNNPFNYTKLNDCEKVEKGEFITMDDLILYFGQENSIFKEGKDNIAKYVLGENHVMEKDVVFTVKESSKVSLDLFYCGTTEVGRSFGVIFFKEGQDPYTQGRNYLLGTISDNDIRKVVPAYTDAWGKKHEEQNNFEANNNNNNSSFQLGRALDYKQNPNNYGWCEQYTLMNSYKKTFKIPYVDEQGNTTYTFPAGTKVAFFLLCNNSPRTSISEVNKNYGLQYTLHEAVAAATYRYGKTTFLAFEDSTDGNCSGDLNDFVFFLNGKFVEKPTQLDPNADPDPEEPTPVKKMTWTLAFEDQISDNKSDFDFNDVVIRVAYAAGEETAKITYCAAGGTLKSELFFNEKSLGEIHAKFDDPERKALINTYSKIDKEFVTEELTVPADFSLSSDASQFKIKVTYWNGEKESCLPNAAAYGSTPHGFCVPGNWAWPRECLNIKQAYPQFEGWAQNASANQNWYEQVNASAVISE